MTRGTHRLSLTLLLGSAATISVAQPQPPNPQNPVGPADLLVGSWRAVILTSEPVFPDVKVTLTFTVNKSYRLVTEEDGAVSSLGGTYKVEGQRLTLFKDPPTGPHPGQGRIVMLTKDRLVVVSEDRSKQVNEFVRVNDKK